MLIEIVMFVSLLEIGLSLESGSKIPTMSQKYVDNYHLPGGNYVFYNFGIYISYMKCVLKFMDLKP
jgi:hypothetical protein